MKLLKDRFVDSIEKGFKNYGLNIEDINPGITEYLLRLKIQDVFSGSEYLGIALKRSVGADFENIWYNIFTSDLIPALDDYKLNGTIPPVSFIVSSDDILNFVNFLKTFDLNANVYQLFTGFSVAGIKKQDINKFYELFKEQRNRDEDDDVISDPDTDLLKRLSERVLNLKNNPKIISMPDLLKNSGRSSTLYNSKINTVSNRSDSIKQNKKPSNIYKKIAIAALLGITIALISSVAKGMYTNINPPVENKTLLSAGMVKSEFFRGFKFAKTPNNSIRSALAKNSNISSKYLNKLADTDIWIDTISNTKNGKEFLLFAANLDIEQARINVASNISTPLYILAELSDDTSDNVRAAVAQNPTINTAIMQKLSDDNSFVSEHLLENSNLTLGILDKILKDPTSTCNFNRRFMSNKLVPLSTIIYNENNPDECTREGIAMNISTPKDIIERLTQDKNSRVRSVALKNINVSSNILNTIFVNDDYFIQTSSDRESDMIAALQNPNISPAILERAIILNPSKFNHIIASNPATPKYLLSNIKMYAEGSQGINEFIIKSKLIISDMDRLKNISDRVKKDNTILVSLKKELNIIFAETIYDPYILTDNMLRYMKVKRAVETNNRSDIMIDTNNYDISIIDNDNIDDMPTNFSDKTQLSTYIIDINNASTIPTVALNVADNIVYEMLTYLLPDVENTLVNQGFVDIKETESYSKPIEEVFYNDEAFFQRSSSSIDKLNSFFDEDEWGN